MFESFVEYLEIFLNLLELVALLISVFTFFFVMLNQYSTALRKILDPCGITFGVKLRALFFCRKSALTKRAFIEYAILKTHGCPTVRRQWNVIFNEFKSFYQNAQSTPVYEIANCTALIGDELSEAAQRYFDFFDTPKAKKAFGIPEGTLSWVMKISIAEAYITPTCLLTGLLSKYEENWSEFIKRFVSTACIAENEKQPYKDIMSNELYFTFAWLLWGPSYELSYKNHWAGLCQISYGDESNSVPAVATADNGTLQRLSDRLKANEKERYGELVNATVSIHENKWYYRNLRNTINPENSYFYNKVEDGSLSFAVQLDDFIPCESYKAHKYYCTAYVWILFELDDPESFSFQPEKSVAFFEHSNLTDHATYEFLIETLVDKCFKHFATVFGDEKYTGRNYRYVCAMNDRIENVFRQKLAERCSSDDAMAEAFATRIFPEAKHSPAITFSTLDEFFDQKTTIHFEELQHSDKASVIDLGNFYTQIYMECFPDPNERETFDSILQYMEDAEGAKNYRYHIVLAKDDENNVLGGAIFNYFKQTKSGVIEFIAVKKDMQSCGIGSQLYRHVLLMLTEDAFNDRHSRLEAIYCEIDSPEYSRSSIKKYLYFWRKNNFRRLNFQYVQPSLSASQEKVKGLWFTMTPVNGQASVSGNTVLKVLSDYMRYCMRIQNPEQHPDYLDMAAQLKDVPSVETTAITEGR